MSGARLIVVYLVFLLPAARGNDEVEDGTVRGDSARCPPVHSTIVQRELHKGSLIRRAQAPIRGTDPVTIPLLGAHRSTWSVPALAQTALSLVAVAVAAGAVRTACLE